MTATDLIRVLGGCLLNGLLVLALAPLFEGGLRKVTARLQSRQGPPLLQPYFDLLKLLGKEDLECGEVPPLQRLAARLSLASVLAVACLLPLGLPPPLAPAADILVLTYLLALTGIATLLAGLAAGSTYAVMGVSREMMRALTLEPVLVAALLAGALQSGTLRLDTVLAGGIYAGAGFPWSALLLAGICLYALQGFLQRVPFDTAEAETEIMDGCLMEYSGPKLALFKWAYMARLIVYSGLLVGLFAPWGSGWPFPFGFLWFWGKVTGVVLVATVAAATHARYRVDQTVRRFAALMLVGALAVALAAFGH